MIARLSITIPDGALVAFAESGADDERCIIALESPAGLPRHDSVALTISVAASVAARLRDEITSALAARERRVRP